MVAYQTRYIQSWRMRFHAVADGFLALPWLWRMTKVITDKVNFPLVNVFIPDRSTQFVFTHYRQSRRPSPSPVTVTVTVTVHMFMSSFRPMTFQSQHDICHQSISLPYCTISLSSTLTSLLKCSIGTITPPPYGARRVAAEFDGPPVPETLRMLNARVASRSGTQRRNVKVFNLRIISRLE